MESYLEAWKKSTRETLAEPRVKEFMASLFKAGFNFSIDSTVAEIDQHTREYALNWAAVAEKHASAGLYRKISDFAGAMDGLYLDLGCGAGQLLCALPQGLKLIGIDINPYSLQIAEENLRNSGKKVERHSGTRIGFLPSNGLVVRAEALMQDLDLGKVQLISDDLRDVGNTMRALYNRGIKADGAFFTLAGGHSAQRAGEIISAMKYHVTGKDPNAVESLGDIIDPVLKNIPYIVRRGGHVYVAIRGGAFGPNLEAGVLSLEEHIGDNYKGKLEVAREIAIPMISERSENGISISHHTTEGGELPEDVKKHIESAQYQLNLSEIKVK